MPDPAHSSPFTRNKELGQQSHGAWTGNLTQSSSLLGKSKHLFFRQKEKAF